MRAAEANDTFHWLCTGEVVFPAMLEAIESAEKSVLLETYIFTPSELANRFRAALERASRRGVRVRVLLDALGSRALPADYWKELAESGGEVRLFNPLALNRFWIRNHRKLLVCDDSAAFVGGFNIAPEYEGDGIVCGWCDIGLQLQGPLAVQLAASFEEMFQLAEFRHKRFMRFHKFNAKRTVDFPKEQILLSGPGKGRSPIKRALHEDLKHARNVQIVAAYFLPDVAAAARFGDGSPPGRPRSDNPGWQVRCDPLPTRGTQSLSAVPQRRGSDSRISTANSACEINDRGRCGLRGVGKS